MKGKRLLEAVISSQCVPAEFSKRWTASSAMKRSLLLVILLTAIVAGFGALLLSATTQKPISVAALGRRYPDIPVEEFQITNRSRRDLWVTCRTMYRTNGTWSSVPRGCAITTHLLRPNSTHKEVAVVPSEG